MTLPRAAAVVLSFLLVPAMHAEDPKVWCATSADTLQTARELAKYGSLVRTNFKTTAANVDVQGKVIVVEPDEVMTPFLNFTDIENRSVHFRRTGPETFAVRTGALEYIDDTGPLAHTFNGRDRNEHRLYTLTQFAFPLGETTLRDLHISERLGVFFAPPVAAGVRQFHWLDAATVREPVVAPLLEPEEPRSLRSSAIDLYIRETSDQVIITWRSRFTLTRAFNPRTDGAIDIQAVLDREGNIRFTYRRVQNLEWGAVLVTTGNEASRENSRVIGAADDSRGDSGGSSVYRNLLDIRRIEVLRIDDSELLEIHLRLGGRIYPAVAEGRVTIQLQFSRGGAVTPISLSFDGDDWRYCTAPSVCATAGGAVRFTTDGVILSILERLIPFSGQSTLSVSTLAPGGGGDSGTLSFTLDGGRRVGVDVTSFESERPAAAPLFESFTVPTLNPFGVWERLREELGLLDEEVDGLAIFQNFPTDIQFYATAYSTVGNAGADGVWAHADLVVGSDVSREPALLHMNRIEASEDTSTRRNFRNYLLAHEFGHRWLYGFTIDKSGQPSSVLNPVSAHPAAYVHTPAAFRVMTGLDYSVMGGSNFTQLHDGTFLVPDEDGAWGFSWHELYLMGLAEPQEVTDWYYIADSDPELEPAYHPDRGVRVSGRRVDVRLRDLTSSMGNRFPAAADSQKVFRLLYVLLQRPTDSADGETTLLNEAIDDFPSFFAAATGYRGSIISTLPGPPTARFEFQDRAGVGARIRFTDTSLNLPVRWEWDFGDGSTSIEQFPLHAYTAPGTYTVILTVENSRGTSSSAQQIVIQEGLRRRPAKK